MGVCDGPLDRQDGLSLSVVDGVNYPTACLSEQILALDFLSLQSLVTSLRLIVQMLV
jgi:hypothetical protein